MLEQARIVYLDVYVSDLAISRDFYERKLGRRVIEEDQNAVKYDGGQIILAPGTNEDKVMEVALEAGADDVITDDDGAIEVLTPYTEFETVKNALETAGLKPEIAEVTMRAENTIELTGDDAARMQKLLDVLEDLDDVQNVFHNASI